MLNIPPPSDIDEFPTNPVPYVILGDEIFPLFYVFRILCICIGIIIIVCIIGFILCCQDSRSGISIAIRIHLMGLVALFQGY